MSEMKRRGRPPRAPDDVEQEKARIAGVAGDLFRREGVPAISMRRLAKEAEVTPKTLYAYFADKREILQNIWSGFFVELFDEIDVVAQSGLSPKARLRSACLRYLTYWVSQPDRYRMVFMSDGVSQSDVSVFMEASPVLARYAIFGDLLASASGAASTEVIPLQLNALVCALNGIAHNTVTISDYDWGAPDTLLDVLLPAFIAA
jgi:AcrR family transcriptional regulator